MKIFSLLFIFLFAISSSFAQRNVVLIIADDLGLEYCGFYGNTGDTVIMPNVQSLLPKGIRFINAWSNPLCSPTRAGILTGRYSFRTGVGDAIGGQTVNTLDTSELTIPRMLNIHKPNGIAKANIGKWHLHNPMPQTNFSLPTKMGYDYYEGNFSGQLANYYAWNKIKDAKAAICSTYATTEITNNAIDWVKSIPSTKPVFLWLAYNAPHTPFNLPPSNLHTYTELKGVAADTAGSVVPYFKAMTQAMDKEIGRLFDSLKTMNRFDSTDFIFIGDNGSDPRVYKGKGRAKGSVYQDGICVPFIVAGPSVKNPGRVSSALVNTHDIFATVLELFGFNDWRTFALPTKPIDSRSFLPIIKGDDATIRDWTFSEVFRATPNASDGKAMRNGEYKLIDLDNGTQNFYNLVNDPDELNDLLSKTLNQTEKSNYEYLCGELSKLVGKNSFCTATAIENDDVSNQLGIAVLEAGTKALIQVPNNICDEFTIEVYSLAGESLLSHKSSHNDITINIAHLPTSLYSVIVRCGASTLKGSMLIQR